MKVGRTILALIFLIIFIAAALVAVDSLRSITYEDVFPEDVNVVIWIHQPLDVPLKVLNSSGARNFLKTEQGRELEKALNDLLLKLQSGPKQEPPPLYTKTIEGVKVYYPDLPQGEEETAEAEEEPATAEAKIEDKELKEVQKLKLAMGVGGAVVKDLYIALYGKQEDVMTAMMMNQPPPFMFAMDLGRLSIFPRLGLPNVKPMPSDKKPEDFQVAFAFVRNFVIAGDVKGIERMIYTIKGKPMQVAVSEDEFAGGEEEKPQKKFETVSLKPLKNSPTWAKVKKHLNKKANFNLAVLLTNVFNQLKSSDAEFGKTSEKFELFRILGFVHSNQMDEKGIQLTTKVVFDPPNVIYKIFNQQEIEMVWPKILPDTFTLGAGMAADSYPDLWDSAQILGDMVAELETTLKARFGVKDLKEFLAKLDKEISIIQFDDEGSSRTVHCDSVTSDAKDYLSNLEVINAEAAIADAEKTIEAARTAGAETYAPEAVETAAMTLEDAKIELEEGRRVMAVVLGRKATEFANAALLTMQKQAEKAINDAMMVGAYSHASEELEAASAALAEAKEAYKQEEWASGTEAAIRALEMGKVAYSFAKAGSAISNAKEAEADTKAASAFSSANSALNNAKNLLAQGKIDEAIAQAEASTLQAKKALAMATGGELDLTVDTIGEIAPIDYTIPEVISPRATETVEIFSSVGTERVDYVLLSDTIMCYGTPEDVDAFLKTPKGEVIKRADVIELMSNIDLKVQGLVLVNIPMLVKQMGMWPEEGELADFLKSLNLMLGVYVISENDTVAATTFSPVKLFDGSTASGARSAMAALFFLAKWLFYLLGIVFLYLGIKMLGGKKKA